MATEVVIFACQQAVPNPDFLRTQWGKENIRLQVLPEPCSSKIEAFQLLRTLATPADLVWVIGCVEEIGLESARVGRSVVIPGDAPGLAEALADIKAKAEALGPSPLKMTGEKGKR
jgi:coenzyme F420-reducing hydrogenase delta subunit